MNEYHSIPDNKTIHDILDEIKSIPCHCQSSRFIEINKFGMVEIGPMNDFDYNIFWNCMKIFEAYGINYFSDYLCLRRGGYGDFSQGIDVWFNNKSIIGWRPTSDQFIEFVKLLHFFEIPSYDGISLSTFEENSKYATLLYQEATDNEMAHRRKKSESTIQQRIKNYFNYDEYSEGEFNELSNNLISKQQDSISINEALELAKIAPSNIYIVFLKRNNKVCHIGKTEQPLSYIGSHYKKFDADSAYFTDIDANYVDDLIVNMRVFYDIEVNKIRPSFLNRKYATVKQAIFAYKRLEGIPRKQVLAAIERGKMRVIELGNEQELIDKIELHRNLFSQL